jgi:hypothetical protein
MRRFGGMQVTFRQRAATPLSVAAAAFRAAACSADNLSWSLRGDVVSCSFRCIFSTYPTRAPKIPSRNSRLTHSPSMPRTRTDVPAGSFVSGVREESGNKKIGAPSVTIVAAFRPEYWPCAVPATNTTRTPANTAHHRMRLWFELTRGALLSWIAIAFDHDRLDACGQALRQFGVRCVSRSTQRAPAEILLRPDRHRRRRPHLQTADAIPPIPAPRHIADSWIFARTVHVICGPGEKWLLPHLHEASVRAWQRHPCRRRHSRCSARTG